MEARMLLANTVIQNAYRAIQTATDMAKESLIAYLSEVKKHEFSNGDLIINAYIGNVLVDKIYLNEEGDKVIIHGYTETDTKEVTLLAPFNYSEYELTEVVRQIYFNRLDKE